MSGKKPSKAEEDESTLKIPSTFRKKCDLNGVVPSKALKDKAEEAVENGKLQVLQTWGEIGPICCRAFMECLIEIKYQHLKKIRIWKADLQDEGVRSICNYIQKCNTIEYLDLMENNISDLGCEFLAKVMMNPANKITKLRLDNNKIGLKGLAALSEGLRQNNNIEKISLNFCSIPAEGCKYIQEILANLDSKLRTLKLQGNNLGNEGFYEVIRAVHACGDKLEKLNLADTGLNMLNYPSKDGSKYDHNDEEHGYDTQRENQDEGEDMDFENIDIEDPYDPLERKIMKKLCLLLRDNQSIAKYNFKNNYISDNLAMKMLNKVKDNKNIFIIDLPECITYELKEHHVEIMKKRKPKKKKAKKAGKGKKK